MKCVIVRCNFTLLVEGFVFWCVRLGIFETKRWREVRTWRGKLILWSLVSMLAVALVFAGVTYANLRQAMLEEEKRELGVRVDALVRILQEKPADFRALLSSSDEERRAAERYWEGRLRAFLYPDERLVLFRVGGAELLRIEGDGEEINGNAGSSSAGEDIQEGSGEHGVEETSGQISQGLHSFMGFTLQREFELEGATFTLRIDHPSTRLQTLTTLLLRSLFVGLVVAAVGSTVGALFLSRAFLRPLHALLQTFRRVREADLSARASVGSVDDELAELARTFNTMMDAVETSIMRERRFFANAAHELRTPLAAISGHVEFLSRWGEHDPERASRSLEAIREETERLTHLVGGILALERLEDPDALLALSGRCAAKDVFPSIVEEYALLYPRVVFSFSEDFSSSIDHTSIVFPLACESLRHLARILLDGAQGGERGRIEMHAFAERAKVGFFVRDYGPGIPERDLPHVFERFYRGDPARRRGGYGLGLSIARAIVERTGGEISLANVSGGGLRATIHWPLPI